jgi:hypothetical protein
MATLKNIPDKDLKDFLATNGGGSFDDIVEAKMRNYVAQQLAELRLLFIILGWSVEGLIGIGLIALAFTNFLAFIFIVGTFLFAGWFFG